jgi:hypothetical protein
MAGKNDFLLWATGTNANVLTQAAYVALGNRASGAVAGIASAQLYNKSIRQSSIISNMIAQFIIDRLGTVDVLDDGTVPTIEANFLAAIRSCFSIPNTGVVPGTYGPTMTLAVQADGRITSLVNAGLPPTGITPGTYVGTTVTVGADGRITGIVGVPYGPLASNNTWTGSNIFNQLLHAAAGLTSNSGDITALNGRLRASFGAVGSGDANASSILSDFQLSASGGDFWLEIPCVSTPGGLILIQGGFQNLPISNPGPTTTLYNLPRTFPTAFVNCWASLSGSNPNADNAVAAAPANTSQIWLSAAGTTPGPYGTSYLAFGY